MGGSATRWETTLDDVPRAAGALTLRLVLTKFGAPAVEIAYRVLLEPLD